MIVPAARTTDAKHGRSAGQAEPLLTDLLQAVSRSFYLTLRILPAPVRRPLSIAYLLARTSDTIADTELIPPDTREASLHQLAQAIQGRHSPGDCTPYLPHQTQTKERVLLKRIRESVALLETVDNDDRRFIRDVLQIIISGQSLDLKRFQNAAAGNLICLKSDAELDDYTYRVAGCVGEFWTRICFRHLRSDGAAPPPERLRAGVRFGKGLQLVNILRDLAGDTQQGRCYLPKDALLQCGLEPNDLVNPAVDKIRKKIAPLFHRYIQKANDHLTAGWEYTNQLPRRWVRVRLACAWPVLIGRQTLEALPLYDPLNPSRRAKISRRAVKAIVAKTILAYPFPRLWQRLARSRPPR